jgi:hypothetical protein
MNKYVFLFLSLVSSASAYESVDYTCLNNCTASGSMYSFCQSKCTYEAMPAPKIRNIDYNCLNQCTAKGMMYNFCQERCSY